MNKELKVSDFVPAWDNIIIRPIKLTEKGDFVRPLNEEDKSELGEVIAVPEAVETFKVGDIVLFNKYSSTSIDIDHDALIVRSEDVVAYYRE